MPTSKLKLPTLTGNETADVARDFNALANAIDEKAGVPDGLATLDPDGKIPEEQLNVDTSWAATKQELASHSAEDVSQGEVHGLRVTEGKLEYFDGQEWQRVVVSTKQKIYGVKIDKTNSNPETAVTYTDDAIGMIGGSSDWDNIYPFNQIRPVMFKNGAVNYELDKNDFTKKIDGTSADIASGNDGDVMIEFPKIWWKFETIGTDLYVKYADKQIDSNWKCLAHTKGSVEKDKVYIGAYLGYELSGKLRSLSGKSPTVEKTIGEFRTLAEANGSGYQQMGYFQLLMLQVLYLIRYKSLDSQTALGRGYADENSSSTTTGGTNTKGMDYGETTGKYQMKFCGIEDFWGNCFYWIDGLVTDGSSNILIGTQNFNDSGSGYTNYVQGTSNISGYISDVQGGTETGFIIKSKGGSSTTHYSDYGNLFASQVARFGGYWSDDSNAGAFYLSLYYSASHSFSVVAARLAWL